ncbi:hypothetical protein Tco_0381188 [Tanacetum coccineum]
MEISMADQIALDDAFVAPVNRLKIGKCNFRLSSDVTSKEATLQVVYDVLKLTPFYKAFQVSADVPEIYMQEFWASAYIHNRSVRFKMNNKKHILNLDQFRDVLQICPKVGNAKFEEPPLEKEILAFLASLGHSGEIRKITDVNVNKLHQPWRSFASIINKCLSGKTSYDSLCLSQAQILWGMYNNKKVDYAYLLWEDFIYQIENKNTKKGSTIDDPMFTTINVISRNEDTQLYGAILPLELTNEDIRNSESYKEYYVIASGKVPPKIKASKKKDDSDATTMQKPPTVPKEMKSKNGSGADEGTDEDKNEDDENVQDDDDDAKSGDDEFKSQDDQDDDDEEQTESEDDGDDFIHPKLTTHDDETTHEEETNEDDSFNPTIYTPSHVSSSDDEDRRDDIMADVILPQVQATQETEDTHVTLTPVNPDGQQQSSLVSSGFISNMLNPNQDIGVDAIFGHNGEATSLVDIPVTAIAEPSFFAPTNRPPTPTPLFIQLQQPPILTSATTLSSVLQNLPTFGSLFGFDNKLKALEGNFSEFKQTNQYAEVLSSIPGIVDKYLANKMKEAVDVESKTSHAVAANLSEPELKKILINKMEANKSISRSDIQRKLYKALVDAYEADKILLDTYGDTVIIKRPQDETTTTAGKTTTGSKTHKQSASQSAPVEETILLSPDRARNKSVLADHESVQPWLSKDKKNRLMHIDELHKFSDGTLDDVQTALNDRLKGIRMKYLP